MEPLLAQAYESLLHVEKLTGVTLVGRKSIAQEVADANAGVRHDLAHFNQLVQELIDGRDSFDLSELKIRLIHLRIHAMGIVSEFDNLVDAIAQVFVQTSGDDV